MKEREDILLERWRSRRDVEALGELFDLAAPKLLKIGIHLIGDAVEAEDLVQQTFLAAIEQREQLDAARPALPWLVGVLTNKASDLRRRAARGLDYERLYEREAEQTDAPLERRELSAELAKAVDALDEPYRQVLILRLRHGLAAGDIAHVLERSPGTVRVQLHRAHEKLRELLPVSMLGTLALDVAALRGLLSIKALVLHEASAVATSLTLSTSIGAWIMSHKVILVCATLMATASLAVWSASESFVPTGASVGANMEQASVAPPTQLAPRVATLAPNVQGAARTELSNSSAQQPGALSLSGVITDLATGAPIAGALLQLYAPRKTTISAALRDHPELYQVEAKGQVRSRTGGDWPYLARVTDAARFGGEKVLAYDLPDSSAAPLAETYSDHEGRYRLPATMDGGLLSCSHPKYMRRWRAAHDPNQSWSVAMSAESLLSGEVVFASGELPKHPLTLVFSAIGFPGGAMPSNHGASAARNVERAMPVVSSAAHNFEGVGVWQAQTKSDGSFQVQVGTRNVSVSVLEPGWRVNHVGRIQVGRSARIQLERLPILRFLDAKSGEPIEHVRLLGRERQNGYVLWAGAFEAPGGTLTLPGDRRYLETLHQTTIEFQVWADGYAATTRQLTEIDLIESEEFLLESGDIAALDGSVRRGATPSHTATAALMGHSPVQWNATNDELVDGVRVDEQGLFHLEAPAGIYILRVVDRGEVYFEQVTLPATAPVDLDFGALASIEISLVDVEGSEVTNELILLIGEDGGQITRYTNEQGVANFAPLSPGTYLLGIPRLYRAGSISADEMQSIDLARGEQKSLRIEIPVELGSRFARLAVPGAGNFDGWRARYRSLEWTAIEADGRIPLDLATQWSHFEFMAPDQRSWTMPIPKEESEGYVMHLDAGEESYRGVLLDGKGAPLAGVRIFAEPWVKRESQIIASVVTDARGGFKLTGLGDVLHYLTFHQNASRDHRSDTDSDFKGITFCPRENPDEDTWLELRIPKDTPLQRVHGIVKHESDGRPVVDNSMLVECVEPGPYGKLLMGLDAGITRTDNEGRFDLMLPRSSHHTIFVFGAKRGEPVRLETTLQSSGLDEEPEIELFVP